MCSLPVVCGYAPSGASVSRCRAVYAASAETNGAVAKNGLSPHLIRRLLCRRHLPLQGKATNSCFPLLRGKERKQKASPRGEGPAVGELDEV